MTKKRGWKNGNGKIIYYARWRKKLSCRRKKCELKKQQSHARTDITNAAALNKMLTAENHLFFHFVLFRSNSVCGSYYWIWSSHLSADTCACRMCVWVSEWRTFRLIELQRTHSTIHMNGVFVSHSIILTFSWIIFKTAVDSGEDDDQIKRLIESRIIGCMLEFNVL